MDYYWCHLPSFGKQKTISCKAEPNPPLAKGKGTNAVQVAMLFAAVGFIVAFLFGVPFAKKGMQKGIACSKTRPNEHLTKGFYPLEKQETYGKVTTYGGSLDVMTLHLALVRIVDPNNETTTAAELGPANAVNVPASYIVAPAICAYAASEMGLSLFLISMIGTIVGYLIFMKVIGVWGKKTFDIKKGEKYRDGKCYMRNGEPVDE